MSIRVAPASSAFSTSSFTTDAGRSITSPAAIASATTCGSRRIGAVAIIVVARSWSSASLFSAAIGVMPSRSSEASSLITGFGPGSLIDRVSWSDDVLAIPAERAFAFLCGEQLPGSNQDAARDAGELGDVNAVRPIRAARDDAMQERDVGAVLDHLDARVAHPRQGGRRAR